LTVYIPCAIILNCAGIHSANFAMPTGGINVLEELTARAKVTGIKQSGRAIRENRAAKVYFACDADPRLLAPLMEACREGQIPVETVFNRAQLGKACSIEVGAAVAVLLKD